MKSMMKKTLSVIIALAMILVPMSVFAAELGEYDNPYQLTTTSGPRFAVSVAPGAYVYVQVEDSNNSVVSVDYATNANYEIYYCRQTYTAETESGNNTTAFTMVADVNMFTVYNPSESDYVVLYPSLTAGAPVDTTGTWEDPAEVTLADQWGFGFLSANMEVELAANNQGYYYTVTAPADGAITVNVSASDADYNEVGWMFNANNATKGVYGDNILSTDVPAWGYTEYCAVSEGDEVTVFVTTFNPDDPWNAPAATVYTNFGFSALGSSDYPDEAVLGSNVADTDGSGYSYTWTATEAGVVTVTMDDASGWQYNVFVERADGTYYYGDNHQSDVASESVEVASGDIVNITVNTYDPNVWEVPGTVNWTLSFEAGATLGGGDDDQGGDIGGSEDIGGGEDDDTNYADFSDTKLQLGENMYVVDGSYEYTVFSFEPTEVGKYTISSDALVGIAGYHWIDGNPSADTVASNELVWECTDVGQSIYVAVKADVNIATITITREELNVQEIPTTIYDNTTTPEKFDYEGDASELVSVDFEDDVVDTAVLGEDGYYHLNSADGPILYVNLNDSLMSMVSLVGVTSLNSYTIVGGEIVEKIEFYDAMMEYINAADVIELDEETTMYLYPLTEDLMVMYQAGGANKGWYDDAENAPIGPAEDGWMFACYYVPAAEDGGDVPNPEIPDTDNEAFGVAFAMMATVAALGATAVATKRSKKVK